MRHAMPVSARARHSSPDATPRRLDFPPVFTRVRSR